ncbi:MAG: fluoride efflux transporter CrcB [Proteobacteria bacterium]|nr:fluoride efflux transporter CrcB [Pseudomonadota bacterium]MBU1715447.1 fluoride efflux transporter CrcB [Pseudomonadota bacterium]
MTKIIAIMIGGGLGSAFRYALFNLVSRVSGPQFPAGTLAANLLGSFAIGFLWCLFEGTKLSNEWRLFIFTGILGGFTTFSTFSRETTQLIKVGEWKTAITYILVTNSFGIAMVFLGFFLARYFSPLAKH